MSDQIGLDFEAREEPEIKDGFEAPPPTHRGAWGGEQPAADRVAPTVYHLRLMAERLAWHAGVDGITGWEFFLASGHPHEPTVRPRLSELSKVGHGCILRQSRIRRVNGRGTTEGAYVHRDHWRDELHAELPVSGLQEGAEE